MKMIFGKPAETVAQKKVLRWAREEAIKDKKWAVEKQHDREWIKHASIMSKEMFKDRLIKSVDEIANEKYQYLRIRAHSWSDGHVMDPSAQTLWERITGSNPRKPDVFIYRKSR